MANVGPMMEFLEAIRTAGARHGLNLVAAIPTDRYDRAVTPAMRTSSFESAPPSTGAFGDTTLTGPRSIVVIGNGGADFWRAFSRFADRNPGWRDRANPLDDFTREIIEREVVPIVRESGAQCLTVYPFMSSGPTLNFIELAKLAGLGGASIIGVVVNPTYGPWIAFRAALIVDVDLDSPDEAVGFDPCPGCVPRSCITACPAAAVSYPAGWDIPKCLTHRVEVEADCAPRCHARVGCVIGPEHRYPDDELAYHQRRALAAMRPWYETHLRPRR
jgi:epoxyqueuosine reductase